MRLKKTRLTDWNLMIRQVFVEKTRKNKMPRGGHGGGALSLLAWQCLAGKANTEFLRFVRRIALAALQ